MQRTACFYSDQRREEGTAVNVLFLVYGQSGTRNMSVNVSVCARVLPSPLESQLLGLKREGGFGEVHTAVVTALLAPPLALLLTSVHLHHLPLLLRLDGHLATVGWPPALRATCATPQTHTRAVRQAHTLTDSFTKLMKVKLPSSMLIPIRIIMYEDLDMPYIIWGQTCLKNQKPTRPKQNIF